MAGCYARFSLRDGHLTGAMVIGCPDLAKRARPAVEMAMRLPEVVAADPADRFALLVKERKAD